MLKDQHNRDSNQIAPGQTYRLHRLQQAKPNRSGEDLPLYLQQMVYLGSATYANVLTLNSLAHRAWSQATGKRLTLNTKKLEIVKQGKWRLDKEGFSSILSLVRRARISGLIPSCYNKLGLLPDTEESWKSIAEAIWIEPNEDLFLLCPANPHRKYPPILCRSHRLRRPDLHVRPIRRCLPTLSSPLRRRSTGSSPLNKIQIQRAAADRLILVGDPCQGIYAFRGADSDSMNSLQELRSAWQKLPLSVTFRFPKAIERDSSSMQQDLQRSRRTRKVPLRIGLVVSGARSSSLLTPSLSFAETTRLFFPQQSDASRADVAQEFSEERSERA